MRVYVNTYFFEYRLNAVRAPQNIKNLKPNFQKLRDQVEEFVADVQVCKRL